MVFPPFLCHSFRFPHVFVDDEGVRAMQAHLEMVIGAAVASNLTMRGIPKTFPSGKTPNDNKFAETEMGQYNGREEKTWQRIQEEMDEARKDLIFCLSWSCIVHAPKHPRTQASTHQDTSPQFTILEGFFKIDSIVLFYFLFFCS